MDVRTALYRHFNAADELLYVGISLSAIARLSQHREKSSWYNDIANVTIEYFPTRAEALKAELAAIRTEKPKHNKAGAAESQRPVLQPPPKDGLIGLWGHSLDAEGYVDWQFQIDGMIGDRLCKVQLFSWADGRDTAIKIISVDELASGRYSLYATREEWVYASDNSLARRRENDRADLSIWANAPESTL